MEIFQTNPSLKCQTFFFPLGKISNKKKKKNPFYFGRPILEMLRKGVFTFLFSMLRKIRFYVILKYFICFFLHPMVLLDLTLTSLISLI